MASRPISTRARAPMKLFGARLGTFLTTTVVLAAMVLAGGGAVASADSGTVRIEPAANAIVKAPTQVLVHASAPVDPLTSKVSVFNKDHKPMGSAAVRHVADDPTGLIVSVPDLGKGIYTVVWHLSAATTGASLGDGSSAFQVDPKAGSPTIVQHPKVAPVSAPAKKVSAKWLAFLTMMVFIGALAVRFLVTRPVARRAPEADQAELIESTDRRILLVAGVALLGFLPAIWAQLANESNPLLPFWTAVKPGKIWKFITTGNAGHWWFARLALTALAVLVIIPLAANALRRSSAGSGPRFRRATPFMLVGLVAGAIELVVSTVPTTKPASPAMPRAVINTALDMGHLLGAAVWVGGLVALVALVALRLPARQRALFWPKAIRRFSLTATIALGVIILSGVWTAWIHLGSPSLLLSTIYGERLAVKLIMVVALMALGAFNLLYVLPRVAAIRQGTDGGSTFSILMSSFKRTIVLEAMLGAAVLLVVPFLSGSARNQDFQKKAANLTQTKESGAQVVSLKPSGLAAGFADFDVYLPKSKATQVNVTFASTQLGVPETNVTAANLGDGHFRVSGLYTPMVGQWQVKVAATGAPAPAKPASAAFDLKVASAVPKALPKSASPPIHSSTWMWIVVWVLGVFGVLFGANRISRRLMIRRIWASGAPGDPVSNNGSPSHAGELEPQLN